MAGEGRAKRIVGNLGVFGGGNFVMGRVRRFDQKKTHGEFPAIFCMKGNRLVYWGSWGAGKTCHAFGLYEGGTVGQ